VVDLHNPVPSGGYRGARRYQRMTSSDFDSRLRQYGELAVRVGLNLRAGQRLLVIGPLASGGVSLEAAPLVRQIAAAGYRAGASLVEAVWGDDTIQLSRFREAPRDSFAEFSSWLPKALFEHAEAGHAIISVYANDPDQLKDEPPELVSAVQQSVSKHVRPFRELISRNQTNWCVVAAAGEGWASRIFPDVPRAQQVPRLWDAIAKLVRLDRPDPVGAWEAHLESLARRRDFLNAKRYASLKYSGPGTSLTIGLPEGHLWVAGRSESRGGITFAPNLPTEEVFTMPHKDHVDGTVRSTKPLSYGGTVIENFSVTFEGGRAIKVSADRGESVLQQLVDTDAGAARLGEIALVPHSSPVSQSGLLFYNTLFDENAASHVALGSAYKFTLGGGETMGDDEFERAGGNRSGVHVDFMIGSGELDIDGVMANGFTEPLMRRGEWAQSV
jgi:aminopeptidase